MDALEGSRGVGSGRVAGCRLWGGGVFPGDSAPLRVRSGLGKLPMEVRPATRGGYQRQGDSVARSSDPTG